MTLPLAVAMIGMAFSPIAAAMAFLITYEEYRRHSLEKGWALKAALQTAVLTLVFFVGLAVGIGLFVGKVILR